jgi:hypothetical protein
MKLSAWPQEYTDMDVCVLVRNWSFGVQKIREETACRIQVPGMFMRCLMRRESFHKYQPTSLSAN